MAAGTSAHLRWEAESLWQQLVPLLPHLSVEVLARCESTNTTLIERARRAGGDPEAPVTVPGDLPALDDEGAPPRSGAAADAAARFGAGAGRRDDVTPHGRREGDADPCLLVAEQQTRGRGRMGRAWLAAPGTSLTFSLALPLAPRDWSGLSLAVGLAIADALDPDDGRPGALPPRIALKWPNDLWLVDAAGGAKLGGILVETVSVGRRRVCVVGVGLNVQPLPPSLAAELGGVRHACLQELDPLATAPHVLAQVAPPLVRALKAFEQKGFAPLAARYAARDLLRGREVTTTLAQMPSGIAEGVDEGGALLLRAGGGLHRVVSGEVSVRSAPAGAPGPSAAPGATGSA